MTLLDTYKSLSMPDEERFLEELLPIINISTLARVMQDKLTEPEQFSVIAEIGVFYTDDADEIEALQLIASKRFDRRNKKRMIADRANRIRRNASH